MSHPLDSYLQTSSIVESSATFKLLRARSLPLILTFLYREFKGGQELMVPYHMLISKLADYLEEISYSEADEELSEGNKLMLDHHEKAKIYLDKWIDAHYLQNVIDDQSKQAVVLLSKHVEKAFQTVDLLKQKEFVGTESKFKDIFFKLRDLVENSSADKGKRIEELEKRKEQIEAEIRKIKIDGYVATYEDYQIKSRFEEVTRLSNELIGDFREVEDNFKAITRKIYEAQQTVDFTKGKLLKETFEAISELRNTDQGKSFYAFWNFMIDDQAKDELQFLTGSVYRLLEDREIVFQSRSLRKLKTLLHLAGRKVLDKNNLLAEKLSREIIAKQHQENRKTRELMSAIRRKAFNLVGKVNNREFYLEIDGNPEIYLPMERKLGERSTETLTISQPVLALPKNGDIEALAKIYGMAAIDKKQLLDNISALLQIRVQLTLAELVTMRPLTKGLPELLAYISLINHSPKYFVNAEQRDLILFNAEQGKYLETPQIIFSR